jgi:hypothetical protein
LSIGVRSAIDKYCFTDFSIVTSKFFVPIDTRHALTEIGTEELRTPEAPKDLELRVEAFLEKGEGYAPGTSDLWHYIERSKRETMREMEEFFENEADPPREA